MIEIIEINNNNIKLLEDFIRNELPNTFRYFSKRDISCINNHIITIILLLDDKPIGYAHIDYDINENKNWFGICILRDYQLNGYGKLLMNYIFSNSKIKDIDNIYLTVDKINKIAINLYKKYNFEFFDEKESYIVMKK